MTTTNSAVYPYFAISTPAEDDIKNRCQIYNQLIQKHCTDVLNGDNHQPVFELLNLKADDLKQLLRDIDGLLFRRWPLRITSTSNSLRIRIQTLVPSSPHEVAVEILSSQIEDAYKAATPGQYWIEDITPIGTTRQTARNLNLTKEPDWSLCPSSRGHNTVPSIIMEVGISETMAQLAQDKDEWLRFEGVLTVILVKIYIGQLTMADAVKISVWTRDENRVPIERATWQYTLSSPNIDDLVLFVSDFFNLVEMPAHLNGATVVTVPSAQLVWFIRRVLS